MADPSKRVTRPGGSPRISAAATPLSFPGHPSTDKAAARKLYGTGLGGMVFGDGVQHRLGRICKGLNLNEGSINFIEDMLERMAPRDPLEELLVIQAALAYARVLHLTELANQQQSLESIRTINEYADRASNTYRRLMLGLAEYRRPPRGGDSFTAIRQANIAGQQLIQNRVEQTNDRATSEQGCDGIEDPAALPADTGGSGFTEIGSQAHETVGEIHGAQNSKRQRDKQAKRLAAR